MFDPLPSLILERWSTDTPPPQSYTINTPKTVIGRIGDLYVLLGLGALTVSGDYPLHSFLNDIVLLNGLEERDFAWLI